MDGKEDWKRSIRDLVLKLKHHQELQESYFSDNIIKSIDACAEHKQPFEAYSSIYMNKNIQNFLAASSLKNASGGISEFSEQDQVKFYVRLLETIGMADMDAHLDKNIQHMLDLRADESITSNKIRTHIRSF